MELKADLKRCGISQEDWKYYLLPPQAWDCNIMSASGLTRWVEIILTARTTSKPIWLRPDQLAQFKQLRDKVRAVMDVIAEIEKFKEREDPDDNTFTFHCKRAGDEAGQINIRLQNACRALQDVCLDEGFDREFLNSVS